MLKNLQMAYLLTELPYLGKSIHFFNGNLMKYWNWNMLLVLVQYLQEKSLMS